MSWWDSVEGAFGEWLGALIGSTASLELGREKAFGGNVVEQGYNKATAAGASIGSKVDTIQAGYEKTAGVKPAATPSPSPASTPAPTDAPPALLGNGSSDAEGQAIAQKANEKMASTQRQTQGTIGQADPSLPVFEKREKKKGFAPSGLNSRDVSPTMVTNDVTRTLELVASDPYGWDPKKLKTIYQMMVDAGHIKVGSPIDRMEIAGIWAKYAATSALMYQKGNRMTPFDLLKGQSYGGQIGTQSLAKTVTSSDTNYTVTSATSAKELAMAALSQRVGRKATDDEVNTFIAALRKEEKANPTVQTSTTTTNADGTSRTSTGTTKQGVDVAAFQKSYADGYDTEEAKAYQAAGYYAPIFFAALQAPA